MYFLKEEEKFRKTSHDPWIIKNRLAIIYNIWEYIDPWKTDLQTKLNKNYLKISVETIVKGIN